jgi:hypothetical protein
MLASGIKSRPSFISVKSLTLNSLDRGGIAGPKSCTAAPAGRIGWSE